MKLSEYFEQFNYCNDTTCIKSDNLDLIEQTIMQIVKEEGYISISQPPLPSNLAFSLSHKLLASNYLMKPYIWVFALYHSKLSKGWTVLKSSVPEFLCSRKEDDNVPRLTNLATLSDSEAFHHNVRNSHWGALLETNTCGETVASGYVDCLDPENMMFHSESVINSSESKNFLLLDLPPKFQTAGISRMRRSKEERRKRNFELEAIVKEDPGALDLISLEYRELNMGIRESIDRDLCNLLCNSHVYWETNNLLYQSYYESEFLKNFRVRLLFFQVGAFELETDTGEIWSLLTSFSRKRFSNDMLKMSRKLNCIF